MEDYINASRPAFHTAVNTINQEKQEDLAHLRNLFFKVQSYLIEEVGHLAFKSWLSKLSIIRLKNGVLYLSLQFRH